MYIKTLTIQGFKSYRDQIQIDPFSPKHNVVVGRNGSGKSNFFAAIRFVLSDAYTGMGREERQSLLHEGAGLAAILSAYVEIVFDNSDNRFPTGKPEVVLRRTIGLKKDEYSLDRKLSSKADVMNLLESAGFSKSNPYYIVPQGRITALTNASAVERLALLKEVAGTKVYETRRTESLKIMGETEAKRSKIGELLQYIESRLEELEVEREELKRYQVADRERRCLEYGVYQRELEEVMQRLDDIEEERRREVHQSNQGREKYDQRAGEIKRLQDLITANAQVRAELATTRSTIHAELTDLRRRHASLNVLVGDLQENSVTTTELQKKYNKEIKIVDKEIEKKETELERLRPRWQDNRRFEYEAKKSLESVSTQLKALFEKKGRMALYTSKQERDTYLRSEIKSIEESQKSQSVALENAQKGLATTRDELSQFETQIEAVRDQMNDSRNRVADLADGMVKLKEEQRAKNEKRKELWREDAKMQNQAAYAQDQFSIANAELASMMDKDTGNALRAIDKLASQPGFSGVHGPLYKLFTIKDETFSTAIEVTAGASLFHVVVDNDVTAEKLVKHLLKENAGRVTIMPLNRLNPRVTTPTNLTDALPILNYVEYDPVHEKALQQVFGKTCVCKDLSIATAYVKTHGINTITLDGDKVDGKGALTGGYHDPRRSRIDAVNHAMTWKQKADDDSKRSKEIKQDLLRLDQDITRIVGKQQVMASQQLQARDARYTFQEEGMAITREAARIKDNIAAMEVVEKELQSDLDNLKTKKDVLQKELQSPMNDSSQMSAQDLQLMDQLGEQQESFKTDVIEASRKRVETDGAKNMLEIEINEKLRVRRDELQIKIDALSETQSGESTSATNRAAKEKELDAMSASISALSKQYTATDKEFDKVTAEHSDLEKSLDKEQVDQSEENRGMNRQQKATEKYLAKKNMLTARRDECNRSIRDLGVLPEEAFTDKTENDLEMLMSNLHQVNEDLKKFAHVNKKAFEQYNNFTKQRDDLKSRRSELDQSAASITELVENLDQRKDEAIQKTFDQVADNFKEVFERLVPAGTGRLIIQRRSRLSPDGGEEEQEEQEEVPATDDSQMVSLTDSYTGISVRVSFNSKLDEGVRIQQLSGGQKSLVALATIFAIQKCDPAPFYLFDEIDANLDAQYRTAVASMIQSLASTAQFITTTFRPEMLEHADKFYGVIFNAQKVSSIRTIERQEAAEFVDKEIQAQ